MDEEQLKDLIRDVPDFRKPGISYKDITTLLKDPVALKAATHSMLKPFAATGVECVVGIESRGFILATPMAIELGCGFAPVRKPGKLPAQTLKLEYDLEYGSDAVEIHADAIEPGQKVLSVDDVLATGGTMAAHTCGDPHRLVACSIKFFSQLRYFELIPCYHENSWFLRGIPSIEIFHVFIGFGQKLM